MAQIQNGLPDGVIKALKIVRKVLVFGIIICFFAALMWLIADNAPESKKEETSTGQQHGTTQTDPYGDYDLYAAAGTQFNIPLQPDKWYTVRVQDGMDWRYAFTSRHAGEYAYVKLTGIPPQLDWASSARDDIHISRYHGRIVRFCGKGTLRFEVDNYRLLPY
jgi:hypothetical protein